MRAVAAALLVACGGSHHEPATTPAPGSGHVDAAEGAQPLGLPVYPGAIETSAPGIGPQTWSTTAAADDVRAFYTPPHLPGFQVDIAGATDEHPRHIVDALGHRSYELVVSDASGATTITIVTTITP